MKLHNLQWSERFSTGAASVDSGHQSLFAAVNRFNAVIIEHCQRPCATSIAAVEVAYRALFENLRDQFRSEEAVMEEAAYPLQAHHAQMHHYILIEIDYIMRGENPAINDPAGLEFLADLIGKWLVSHSLSADRKFAVYLIRRECGSDSGSPEIAPRFAVSEAAD